MIVLFDQRVNAGMMRIKVKAAVEELAALCKAVIVELEAKGEGDDIEINWGMDELDFDWMAKDLSDILGS